MKYGLLLLTIFLPIIFFIDSNAQEIPELITDRPDITESAVLVPVNSIQVETGFIFQKQKFFENSIEVNVDELIFASTLIRYGINDLFELRFGGEYISSKATIDNLSSTTSGLNGLFVGTKISIWNNRDIINDLAIILEANLPYGNKDLRPENIEPVIKITAAQVLSEIISLGINLGYESNSSIDKNNYTYSAALGVELGERISMFVEMYGMAANKLIPLHYLDAGLTYLHKQNLQLDISAGSVLFSDDTELFGSFGISVRLPN